MKFSLKPLSLALAAVLFAGCSITQTNTGDGNIVPTVAPAPVIPELTYVRTVEGIDEYTLPNGLKVLLLEDAAQPKTLVNITYRVGSVHEEYGETGMAHLLEHMLFKGSTNYPKIEDEFKKRGMGINATTWLDRTNYFEVFETNDDNLAWALGMEADRMINATFTEDELKSEMTVVRNEMERGENSPVRILLARMASMAYLWHNYGNSTIGARSDVENFPFPKLRAFYKKHYRPDNAVLTIAGRFDKEKTKQMIAEKFGVIAKPETPIEPLYTKEPTQDGERIVNLRRVGDVPWVGLSYHAPSGLHPDAAPIRVLQQILGDNARGRLKADIVDKGIATAAYAFSFMLKDSSRIMFAAQGSKDQATDKMEQALIAQAEDLINNPVTEEEVKRAKTTLLKQTEMAMRNVQGIGMELSEYIAKGDYRHMFYFRDLIEQVTPEQVKQVAEKYLVRSNRTLGRFIPTEKPVRAEIPETGSLDEILKDYKGKQVASAGEVYDNTVSNIKARLQAETWPNGTELQVYPKQLRGDEIHIKMTLPTGSAKSLAGNVAAFNMLGSQLMSGSQKYSKAQLADKLDAIKSTMSVSSRLGEWHVNVTTDKANFAEAVKLLGEILSKPTFPQTELDNAIRASVSGLEQQRNEPSARALDNYRKSLNAYPQGHPRAFVELDDKIAEIKSVTRQQLSDLYQQHITINHGVIAIVGDIELNQASSALQAAIGHLNKNVEFKYMANQMHDKQGLSVSSETPDKANASLYIINRLDLKPSHPDYLALNMANSIFGADTFSSRIGKRIRVEEGYSYSVRSGLSVDEMDEQGVFWAMAIAAPENVQNVIRAYKEEVQKVLDNGFTAEELAQAKEGFINSRKRAWASDAGIADILNYNKQIKRDLAFYDEQESQLANVSLEQVNQAFAKYIAAKEINTFMAGDFAKLKK
ncbi:insulinase family protein [Saccharobesus litoralis]|uniref:Insulinase family protein n=1 Tax=Saccharobesus litoralis TaxID=2172099 RepID=A0A2S0VWV5_9ALTE|nr:pitrilysin family protein [Saccharobesus litoralis]AWB68663.1 insulinase family protein [Saccharobesus litoralis]